MGNKKQVKYSIIIPIYDPAGKMKHIIDRCLESVLKSSLGCRYEIVQVRNVRGFPVAVNKGLKKAKGDYLVVLNDDVEVNDPQWLEKLADENKITSWRLHPFFITQRLVPDGACWAMSRTIFKKLGYLDERFAVGYGFEDSDYWMRAEEARIEFKDAHVDLIHLENKTFRTYHENDKNQMTELNHSLFLQKWEHRL